MNKIVREHYPASKLPDDLRTGLPGSATVRVTIEAESTKLTVQEMLEQLKQVRQKLPHKVSIEEAVQRIRTLRDEWDD